MRWLTLLLLSPLALWSYPSQVILIRHAEKPPQGNFLSLKGRERAAALVPNFLGNPKLLQYGRPAAIYAMKPLKDDGSIRSEQTVMILADDLDLPLKNKFTFGETSKLVQEILDSEEYKEKMVLVCWPHAELPKLAAELGAKDAPKKWAGNIYDRYWILTFDNNRVVSFEDLPQRLLYGDSNR